MEVRVQGKDPLKAMWVRIELKKIETCVYLSRAWDRPLKWRTGCCKVKEDPLARLLVRRRRSGKRRMGTTKTSTPCVTKSVVRNFPTG